MAKKKVKRKKPEAKKSESRKAVKKSTARRKTAPQTRKAAPKKTRKKAAVKKTVKRPAKRAGRVSPDALRKKTDEVLSRTLSVSAPEQSGTVKDRSMPKPIPVFENRPEFDQPLPELPENYGDTLIYLMVRDPHWMFAYWEVQPANQKKALNELGGSWSSVRSVLRVYDVSDGAGAVPYFDIELDGQSDRWYIHVQPAHRYRVEIGLRHKDGRFVALAASNEVETPRAGLSDVLDETWVGSAQQEEIIRLSGGANLSAARGGSMELTELFEKNLLAGLSSGSGSGVLSSLSSMSLSSKMEKKGKDRKFWFVLDCEVIVYGATEPDAKVTFQGKPVKLKSDGTFSFRFALPDGDFVFDAKAESSDGIEERVITPTVTRRTDRPAPVIRKTQEAY